MLKNNKLLKDDIKIVDGKKYILKKQSDFWISLWIIIVVLTFFIGANLGHQYKVKELNDKMNEFLEEIKETEYYSMQNDEKKEMIDNIIIKKQLEIG